MDYFTMQQILERCKPKICGTIMTIFVDFHDDKNVTMKMKIYKKYEYDPSYVIKEGDANVLKFMFENGCDIGLVSVVTATRFGQVECLKYLHDVGIFDMYLKTCCLDMRGELDYLAAGNGQIECLKLLREYGYIFSDMTCFEANINGHLKCLEFLHDIGYNFSSRVCADAAMSGCLECLKYLREIGCPWDERTCFLSAKNEQIDCLKYAVANGCPINIEECIENTFGECLKYLVNLRVTKK
jgi:hypothetical protein